MVRLDASTLGIIKNILKLIKGSIMLARSFFFLILPAERREHIGFWIYTKGAEFAQMVFHSSTMHTNIFQQR